MNATGMGLGMWIFWLITILIVVLIIKELMGSDNKKTISPPESPLKILEKRYARGEIDKNEFEDMKKELEK